MKPKVAFFDFASCEGCQLAVLELENELLDLLGLVEIVNFREAMDDRREDYDIAFLEGISAALRPDVPDVPDLENMELNGEIIFFPMSGSNLACWSSRLAPLNHREFHLCDRDFAPPAAAKYQAHVDAVNARPSCRARSTSKKEMENYLHRDAIISAYQQNGINLPIVANFGPFDDVPQGVARLVHEASGGGLSWDQLPDDKKEEKEKRAKRILCALATKQMNLALLNEIDPDGDLLAWFHDIRQLLT